MTSQTQTATCICGRKVTRGRYCEPCLRDETEGNPITHEDLQAAAAHYDRARGTTTPRDGDDG